MNRSGKYFKRITLLVSALMLMLLLCGCRTRITNNTEVSETITDESGMITESYQMRRDELGIPIAEAPLFSGSGSEEDSEDYEEEYDEEYEEEYDEELDEEEEYDEDLEEEEEEDEDTTPTTTTPTYRPSTPVVRPTPVTPQTTTITVTLNLNAKDAKCIRTSQIVRKDSTYGMLPTPTREGYTFQGWYTAKSKGKKVESTTKVTTDKAHTLYAHWKEIKKKKYTITFDGNGDDDEVKLSATEKKVEEGGTYGDLPTAKRSKYTFKGWFTDASKGTQVTKKTNFTANQNQTLYAHWEQNLYKWWKGEFDKSANEITSEAEIAYLLDDESEGDADKADNFLKTCRVKKIEEESTPDIIVRFVKKYDEETITAEVDAIREKHAETSPDARIVIISRDALYGEKEVKLLYMMKMLDNIYGGNYDINEAEYDLNDGESVSIYISEE